ncbi:MAG: putative DNA binding domain-containing protein, partial [Elusimicrobia bacterium]|nr:putative DNA binding domain-containing protein [Elusimicrobiota bacterium]
MNKLELRQLLQEGEGYKIEFKEALSNLDKELVAFANSSGGRIFIGVRDDKTVKGINITNSLKSQVQDIANHCQPPVKILFEAFENVLIVEVREGTDKPYKCSSGFYNRLGPNSQKLHRDDIIDFFKTEGKIRFDELFNPKFDFKDQFSKEKLSRFLKLAGISNILPTHATLANLGAAEQQEGKTLLNNAGVLLFSKDLSRVYRQAAFTCALYKGVEKVDVLDRKDFNEDLLANIEDAMTFLKKHIPVRYEMTGEARRREVYEVPLEALREAVINAAVHRDYFERGANVMVEIFDDRIDVSNPGGLPKGMTISDLGKKSVLRNPLIADLLSRADYIEKMGTGVNKMRRLMKAAGLRRPKFESTGFLTISFVRPGFYSGSSEKTNPKSSEKTTPQTTPKTTPKT